MLIQLTTHCSEGCKHCFGACVPDNTHMTWDVLRNTVAYIKSLPVAEMEVFVGSKMGLRPVNIIVSGGEPTEHPEYDEMLAYLATELDYCNIILETNGQWFYTEEGRVKMRKVLELNQVSMVLNSSDHRYNPSYNKFKINEESILQFGKDVAKELNPSLNEFELTRQNKIVINLDLSEHMETVRLGRASDFKEVSNPRPAVPNCIQLTYMAQEQSSLSSILVSLEHRGLYTSPVFGTDGTIYPGYSHLCQSVGTIVDTSPEELYTYLKDRVEPCGKCQMNHRIPDNVNLHINQSRKLTGLIS